MGDASMAELVLDARNKTGESPVWHGAEQALYWVDIPARKLWRWTPSTGQATSWLAPEMLGCIAPIATANSWIAGAESGVFRLSPQADGQLGFELLRRSATPCRACVSTMAAATARAVSSPAPC